MALEQMTKKEWGENYERKNPTQRNTMKKKGKRNEKKVKRNKEKER